MSSRSEDEFNNSDQCSQCTCVLVYGARLPLEALQMKAVVSYMGQGPKPYKHTLDWGYQLHPQGDARSAGPGAVKKSCMSGA